MAPRSGSGPSLQTRKPPVLTRWGFLLTGSIVAAISSKLRSVSDKEGRFGVLFWCPGCDEPHCVWVQGPGSVWTWDENAERPTFNPSVLIRRGHYVPGEEGRDCWCSYTARTKRKAPFSCSVCHSFVRDGRIEFLSDCTHKMAGQTVELPDWTRGD
jgi:hypothetical protein